MIMTMDVNVRNACLEDLDVMTELLCRVFPVEADFVVDEELQRRGLNLMVSTSDSSHCIKVAEVGGQVVGMGIVQLLISTAEGGRVGLVEDMVVASGFQNRGIGRLIMEHIEIWARDHGVTRLQLLADRTNFHALDFYSEMGWYPTRLICVRRTWNQ